MTKPISQPEGFPDALRTALRGADLTVLGVQEQYGIALQKNVLGLEDVTREKLDRLLSNLPLAPDAKTALEAAYIGPDRSSVYAVTVAGVRRFTQEVLATRANTSSSAISYILHGDQRRRADTCRHEVS
jgi:hypothetical protein